MRAITRRPWFRSFEHYQARALSIESKFLKYTILNMNDFKVRSVTQCLERVRIQVGCVVPLEGGHVDIF